MRNHNLKVGEVVFDTNVGFYGVIVELTENSAVLDMNGKIKGVNLPNGWCETENKMMFDEEIEEKDLRWECDDLNALYQIAWGIKDSRTENIVCYEHIATEDGYPYYSPYLEENLFNFEVIEC